MSALDIPAYVPEITPPVIDSPPSDASLATYGPGVGRGNVEAHVLHTLRTWIIPYLADFERQNGLPPRSTPVPPTPSSVHGDLDFTRFSSELFPEILTVIQPTGAVERYGDGVYASEYAIAVAAVVQVEGDQDAARDLADAYGTALQKLIPQQGYFGYQSDGVTDFATRTRLEDAYSLTFPDSTVRDIVRATLTARTFVPNIAVDNTGPRVPPQNPYAVPLPPVVADKIEVALIRGTPDTSGYVTADAVVLDGTVVPPVTRYEQTTVDDTGTTTTPDD